MTRSFCRQSLTNYNTGPLNLRMTIADLGFLPPVIGLSGVRGPKLGLPGTNTRMEDGRLRMDKAGPRCGNGAPDGAEGSTERNSSMMTGLW